MCLNHHPTTPTTPRHHAILLLFVMSYIKLAQYYGGEPKFCIVFSEAFPKAEQYILNSPNMVKVSLVL